MVCNDTRKNAGGMCEMKTLLVLSAIAILLYGLETYASEPYDSSLFTLERKAELLYTLSQEDNEKNDKENDLRIWFVVVTTGHIRGHGKSGYQTIWHEARFSNDDRISAIKRLLTEGADINARNPETGDTALDAAIFLGRKPVVWFLLNDQNGNKLDAASINSAIKAAEEREDDLVVRRLIDLRESLTGNTLKTAGANPFKHEAVPKDGYDEVARAELIGALQDNVIPYVEFKNTPVFVALERLSQTGHQTIRCPDYCLAAERGSPATNGTVTFSMTNTAFLTVLDKISAQSKRYWGFKGRELFSLPIEWVANQGEWIKRE
jgi:hypothetical protein